MALTPKNKLIFLSQIPGFEGDLQKIDSEATSPSYWSDGNPAKQEGVIQGSSALFSDSATLDPDKASLDKAHLATMKSLSSNPKIAASVARDIYGEDAEAIIKILDVNNALPLSSQLNDGQLLDLIGTYQTTKARVEAKERATEIVDNVDNAAVEDEAVKKFLADEEEKKLLEKALKEKGIVPPDEPKTDSDGNPIPGPSDEEEDAAATEALELELASALKFGPQRYLLQQMPILSPASANRHPKDQISIEYTKTIPLDRSSENPIGKLSQRSEAAKIATLSTKTLSSLVPRIKLSKVSYKDEKTTIIPIPFPFSTGVGKGGQYQPDIKDIFNYSATTTTGTFYKTRAGFGIKSFSWSYIGTDTYSANRDITASLVLYFQDFAQLTVERDSGSGKYKYLDLLLATDENSKAKPNKGKYQQDILVEAGWEIPNSATPEERGIIEDNSVSLLLTMEDYSISFDEGGSGTVELQIDYRARSESLARDKLINVVAPLPETVRKINNLQKAIDAAGDKDERNELKDERTKLISDSKKEAYPRMLNELTKENSIYFSDLSLVDIIKSEQPLIPAIPIPGSAGDSINYLEQAIAAGSSDVLFENAEKADDGRHRIYFTFLGDIVEAAIRIGTNKEVAKMSGTPEGPLSNYKAILCDFKVGNKTYNIADIPIHLSLFGSFMFDKVISEDTQTKSLGMFIKELMAYIVSNKLEKFWNSQNDDSRSFRTSYLEFDSGKSPLLSNNRFGPHKNLRISLNPPSQFVPGVDIPAMIVYSNPSALDLKITGTYADSKKRDEASGIPHFQLGETTSIVKNISFERLSWEYAREHRLVENASSPFNILSNIFNVTIKLFGNVVVEPGSLIFVNPTSMGDIGRPWKKGSISNIMGLGGYHFVTKVDHSISDGTFETSVEAIWNSAGDGKAKFTETDKTGTGTEDS